MDNKSTSDPKVITRYNLKQAFFAVLIGAAISLIGTLSELSIEWLRNYPVEAGGPIAGIVKYWHSWKYNHFS